MSGELNDHDKEVIRHHDLHIKNVLAQDSALLQLSVGIVAILATLGKDILKTNKTLSYLVFICFGATILLVIAGFYFSNIFFVEAKDTIIRNKKDGNAAYKGLSKIVAGKINKALNSIQMLTFLIGFLLFGALIFMYIGDL